MLLVNVIVMFGINVMSIVSLYGNRKVKMLQDQRKIIHFHVIVYLLHYWYWYCLCITFF